MWEISAATVLAARHRIRIASGATHEDGVVHAHRWRIRAVVRAKHLDATGWVLDFHELTAALRALLLPYDGAFINDVPPFDDVNPTRENIARVLADKLAARLNDGRVRVHALEICEDDVCSATYFPDE
jgi:6-pyruvoyltetrahydropterin/6-carboxytetrahydropterin synthase